MQAPPRPIQAQQKKTGRAIPGRVPHSQKIAYTRSGHVPRHFSPDAFHDTSRTRHTAGTSIRRGVNIGHYVAAGAHVYSQLLRSTAAGIEVGPPAPVEAEFRQRSNPPARRASFATVPAMSRTLDKPAAVTSWRQRRRRWEYRMLARTWGVTRARLVPQAPAGDAAAAGSGGGDGAGGGEARPSTPHCAQSPLPRAATALNLRTPLTRVRHRCQ